MIRIDAISKRHGGQILFLEASAAVNRGEKIGLVGPNGSGKTTIFRLITREEEADAGQIAIDRGTAIGYFSQDIGEMKDQSVLDAALDGAGAVSDAARELHELECALADPTRADELDALVERYGEAQSRFESLGGYRLEARARTVLAGLGFTPDQVEADVGALSGGWKMRVGLARILIMSPDALLLDEPTNHLDLESILWLEDWLRAFEGAVVMTSHDREFLNRMVGKIIEIDGGDLITYSGNYDFYERQRALAEREQEAQYARQQAMLAKEEAFIARFKARASHAAQVQSRVKKLDKIEKVAAPKRRETLEFEFRPAPRSGEDVVRLAGVDKAWGERAVFRGLDLLIRRRERWCVMGANGAGKSTLLKLVAGVAAPDAGSVVPGAAVVQGYFAQHSMELLDGDQTVWETLEHAFPQATVGSLRTLAAAFGFPGDDTAKRCRLLSGGEKVRLVMARMLYDPPNFLVLDEPTNHLDLATKEMLIRALADYEGTMLLVSHDRRFLSALTNRVLELETDGPRVYPGGYADYVVASGHEAPGMRGAS
ncbi:MAG: ABC-F family ATP-binding cassette domain-containing protein [Deltaproteobacteria bacterium]|nr:MAG: ABC-F family ATP-binding cassette domain-containing protein [Deltaproteobacteria bacterium]